MLRASAISYGIHANFIYERERVTIKLSTPSLKMATVGIALPSILLLKDFMLLANIIILSEGVKVRLLNFVRAIHSKI